MRWVRVVLAVAALAPLVGCTYTRIQLAELPEEPLALVYRTAEEGRQLAELIEEQEERGNSGARRAALPGASIVDLGDVPEAFGRRPSAHRLRELRGRVSLLHPRTLEREALDAMVRGARPIQWSSGRERLLFMTPRLRASQVYELEVATRELRPITSGPETHPFACYGPDRRFAISRMERQGDLPRMRILLTGPEGAEPQVFTPGPFDFHPAWSPDGSVLVYVTHQAGDVQSIVAQETREGAVPRIIARNGIDPVFTPDGAWVIYSRKTRDGFRLWRMRPDGSGKVALGASNREMRSPAVSPDGGYVAYVSEEAGRQRLRVRRFDGTGDRLLLDDGDAAFPVW